MFDVCKDLLCEVKMLMLGLVLSCLRMVLMGLLGILG